MTTKFTDMWRRRNAAGKHICIGLDPKLSEVRKCVEGEDNAERVYRFMCGIVDATHEYAAAYKPQIAFFEALGDLGHETLRRVIEHIRSVDQNIPVILDYKRGDIGATNVGYVEFAFDYLGVDAVTVHPYLGMEAMGPFLSRADKTIVVLCRTSNPGAGEFQDVLVKPVRSAVTGKLYSTREEGLREGDPASNGEWQANAKMPLFEFVARRVAQSWNANGNCAVVVGATYPEELGKVRAIIGNMPILLPGLGAQGGDMEASFAQGLQDPDDMLVANNASYVNFAYANLRGEDGELRFTPGQFAEASAEAARTMNDAVRTLLPV